MTPVFICHSIVCFLSMPVVLKHGTNNTDVPSKILEENSQYLYEYFKNEKQNPDPIEGDKGSSGTLLTDLKNGQSPPKDTNILPTNSPISIIPYVAETESEAVKNSDDSIKSNYVFLNKEADSKLNLFKPNVNSPVILKIWGAGTESKFPPLIEILVQRIQSMFSTYIYEDLSRPAIVKDPVSTTVKPNQDEAAITNVPPKKHLETSNEIASADVSDSEPPSSTDKLTRTSIKSIQNQLTMGQIDMESRRGQVNPGSVMEPVSYFETLGTDYDIY